MTSQDVRPYTVYPTLVTMYWQDGRWWRRFKHLHKPKTGNAWNRKSIGKTEWQAAVDIATRTMTTW